MPTLICCLSSGKGTWTEVYKVVQAQPWSKVYIITDRFGQQNFNHTNHTSSTIEFILIDTFAEIYTLIDAIKKQVKVADFEVALNLTSGSGKEHTAILEAVMEMGLNFRLITLVNGKVETLGLRTSV